MRFKYNSKWINSLLVYGALVSLFIMLWKANYLFWPQVADIRYLVISIILVCLGFLFQVISWQKILTASYSLPCRYTDALISLGLTVFGKYIPGKVWSITGRAVFFANQKSRSVAKAALASADLQIVALWIGTLLGMFALVAGYQASGHLVVLLSIFVILTVFLMLPTRWHLLEKILYKIFGRKANKSSYSINFSIYLWVACNWLVWSLGFYCLIISLNPGIVSLELGLLFVLATVLSFLAPFVPAGMGIREGLLTGFLVSAGMDISYATTIAIVSRIWFLIGELFIFALGIIAYQFCKDL